MASSPTDLSAALRSIPEKKEYVRKAFEDLEQQRTTVARCAGGWKDLDDHLTHIHDALEKRYAEVLEQEAKFKARTLELQAALDKRGSVIESREQASLARVQEQKDAAVAAIREQKQKWIEERQLLQSQSPAKPTDPDAGSSKAKQSDSTVSSKDEAGAKSKAKPEVKGKDPVNGKEKDSVSKQNDDANAKRTSKEDTASKAKKTKDKPSSTLQKNEDSLKLDEGKKRKLEAELETDKKHKTEKQEGENGGEKQYLVSEDPEDQPRTMMVGDQDGAESGDDSDDAEEDPEDQPRTMEVGEEDGADSGDDSDDAEDEDDEEGSENEEEGLQPSAKMQVQLTSLCENMDGPGLFSFVKSQRKDILELHTALRSASSPSQLVLKAIEGHHSSDSTQGKKLANYRSCATLLECLAVVLTDGEKDDCGISDNTKEEAKNAAQLWKSKLNHKGTNRAAKLDAQNFLQFIATFGLAKEYTQAELCDLVVPISARKGVPALCRKLGLTDKVPGLVQRLINDGKQLDAVALIEDFELSKKFQSHSLIRAYLRNITQLHVQKSCTENKDQLHLKELNGAKAALNCIRKYSIGFHREKKLEKRIKQLERLVNPETGGSKKRNGGAAGGGSKKRNGGAAGGGSKKPRSNGPGGPNLGAHKFSGRQQSGAQGMGGSNYGSGYGQTGGGGRAGYPYPAGGAGYGTSSYSHGNFQYGGGPPYCGGSYMC